MECGKRETKLTAKAWANKIEKLQHEYKIIVTKIKGHIPENRQNEWFASIMKHSNTFEEDVKK